MPKLSKRVVDGLKPDPSGREAFAWDSELRGFGVRVMPSGVASFLVFYRTTDGRQRKLAIGRVGTMTPEQARQVAREKLTLASKGEDPAADKQAARKVMTVGELCDAYLEHAQGRVKDSTLAMDRSRIDRHVRPLLGRRSVAGLTLDDVEKFQADIAAGKTAAAREGRGGATTGGTGVAGRTVGMLSTIMEYARRKRLVTVNVCRDVKRAADGRQRRYLTLAEIGTLGHAMRQAEQEGENAISIAAIKFLLMSGCRRMEALALHLTLVDRVANCIRFVDTKSGAQIRAVGAVALKVLDDIPHRNGWAFPAARGTGHFVGLPKALDRLCKRARLDGVTTHVLRHSFAATAAEMGFSELTIAGLLGHTVSGVTARYAHVPDSALVAAAGKVAERIADAMAPTPAGAC